MKKTILASILIGILSQAGLAQSFDKTRLDKYFNVLETNNKFMGSVAVSKDGEVIYSNSTGFSDVENNLKADEHSKYRIGSISKTFTSVLILKAVEENRLDLNQTIDNYFPAIKNAEKITIMNLLYHRSGIHNFTNDPDYLTWNTQPMTEKEMVEIIAKAGSDFEPGSQAAYSNSNFVLLSYILEKIFEKPYADLLQELIIQPVGLTNTYFGGQINPTKHECKSYSYLVTWKAEPETDMSIPLGAGGIVSTAGDLVKFSDALFGGELIHSSSLDLMKTIKEGYGIGLFQIPFYDKTGYGHTGGIDGFSSVFSYFSDGNISYALTSNGVNLNTNDVSIAVLSAVYDKPYEIPEFVDSQLTTEELEKYLGVYVSSDIPLKMTITKENTTLIAQATGQPAFPLEFTGADTFEFDRAGVVISFDPAESAMVLKQGGGQFRFVKE